MMRAYVRRKKFEARLMAAEIGRLFSGGGEKGSGGSTSPSSGSGGTTTTAKPAKEKPMVVPAHEALKIMGISLGRNVQDD